MPICNYKKCDTWVFLGGICKECAKIKDNGRVKGIMGN